MSEEIIKSLKNPYDFKVVHKLELTLLTITSKKSSSEISTNFFY